MSIDTHPEVARLVARRYEAMSGAERFMIGMEMFETARQLALASLPDNASDEERRSRLCQRFYPELHERLFAPGRTDPSPGTD